MAGNTSYTIIPELKLIITYCNGRVLMEDIIRLNRNFISDQRYDPSFDLLMDFRESIAIVFKFDILDFFDFLKENVSLKTRVRNGILYSTPNHNFLISIYKPIASLGKIDAENFKDIKLYFDWMKYSEDEQKVINDAICIMRSNSSVKEVIPLP